MRDAVLKGIFWISIGGIAYTYAGYPLLLWLKGWLFPRPVRKGPSEPTASLLIAAHNEAAVIGRKLSSCLALDYPAQKLEIWVGTDASTDETDRIVQRMASARLKAVRLPRRVGKPAVLNALAAQAGGEILVFTDARQRLKADALRRLVENFRDPAVGCVSGELVLTRDENSAVGEGVSAYWRYEKWLRKRESIGGSTVGATGALYAVRRSLFRPLDPQTILDDVAVPLAVVEQGYRAVFEAAALVYDRVASSGPEEFRRKSRTLAGNYQIFARFARLLKPGSPIAWELWSHKLLRTVVPLWLAAALGSSALLGGPLYGAACAAQLLFYGLALVGWEAQQRGSRFARLAYVFCLLNVSAVVGLFRFLRGRQPVTWEKARA